METTTSAVEALYEKTEAYSKTTYELAKLRSLETSNQIVTSLISRITVVIMFSLFALVLNIGIALWLGDLLGRSDYGFFIVAGFYLIAGFVLHFFLLGWIKKPISDLIIKEALQ